MWSSRWTSAGGRTARSPWTRTPNRTRRARRYPPFCAGLFELGYYGDLQVWHVDGREVGVGVGQMDQEEPVVLFALVTASTPVG
ncbi:hypothetical protein GCM10020227_47200 [Streptomyces flavovirens]